MDKTNLLRAGLVLAAAFSLGACDRETTQQAERDVKNASEKVESALERTGEKIADASRKATAEVKEAGRDVKASASNATNDVRTSDSGRDAGRVMSDTAITAAIKGNYLMDPDLSVFKIDVDTKEGVVTLNGLAKDSQAKARAEKLAAANKGVKEVRNHLTLKQG